MSKGTVLEASPMMSKTKQSFLRSRKPVNVDSIEAMTPDTDKLVMGTFVHVQYPGQSKYIYAQYYKGQAPFEMQMEDGEVYTIPLSVARHINERIFEHEHSTLLDVNGNQIKSAKKKHHTRFLYNEGK